MAKKNKQCNQAKLTEYKKQSTIKLSDNDLKWDEIDFDIKLEKQNKRKEIYKNNSNVIAFKQLDEALASVVINRPPNSFGDSIPSALKMNAGIYGNISENATDYFMQYQFAGYQNCALIAQSPMFAVPISAKSYDAIKNGYKIVLTPAPKIINNKPVFDKINDEEIQNYIEWLKYEGNKVNLNKQLKDYTYFCDVFGIRVALQEYEDLDNALYEQDKSKIDQTLLYKTFTGLKQIDPYYCMPNGVGSVDPLSDNFIESDTWQVMGQTVHKSWLIIITTVKPAQMYKMLYRQGGIPTSQLAVKRLYQAEVGADEIEALLLTKRRMYQKVDLDIAISDPERFKRQQEFSARYLDNQAKLLIGDSDEVGQLETNLSDVVDAVLCQFQLTASIYQLPVLKMLSGSPAGLNATGNYETGSYATVLSSVREERLTPFLQAWHTLMLKSYFDLDFNVDINWNAPEVQTELEKAQTEQTSAQTASILNEIGIPENSIDKKLRMSGFDIPPNRKEDDSLYNSEQDEPK